VRRWRADAIAGDAAAAYRVGQALVASPGHRVGVRYLRRAADGGVLAAAEDLAADLMERGQPYRGRDWYQGQEWLSRAGDLARDQGLPAVTVAKYYQRGGRPNLGERVLREAALHDSDAARHLAAWLESPQSDESRTREALRWYERALELGDASVKADVARLRERERQLAERERQLAERDRRERVEADGGNTDAALLVGRRALKAGQYEDAEKYLRMAAGRSNSYWNSYRDNIELIALLTMKGRDSEAGSLIGGDLDRDMDRLDKVASALRGAGYEGAAATWSKRAMRAYMDYHYDGGG
jgi:TPR repeat protein